MPSRKAAHHASPASEEPPKGARRSGTDEETFAPVKLTRHTLNDQVYDGLKEAVMSGSLYPGKVLTIRELATSFGVSVMPVREALSRLIAEKAVVFRPNRSVAVPVLTPDRFRQITKIRLLLENMAVREGAPHLGESDIARLDRINAKLEAIGPSERKTFLELNRQFHFTVYAASGQDYLIGMIESLWLQIGPLLNFILQGLSSSGPTPQVYHRELVAALRKRDAEAAGRAVQADIQDAADFIVQFLEKSQAEGAG